MQMKGGASRGMARRDSGGRGFSNRRSIPSTARTGAESPGRSTTFPEVSAWPGDSCWTRPCSGQEIQTPWEEEKKSDNKNLVLSYLPCAHRSIKYGPDSSTNVLNIRCISR